jgi:hypothetical protein
MAARAKLAVAFFGMFATTWLLFDSGAVDGLLAKVAGAGEADSPAVRGVRRLQYSSSSSGSAESSSQQYSGTLSVVLQLLYGVVYYYCVVTHYPELQGGPTDEAKETQGKNEVMAFITCENSLVINLTALFCPAARAAHTYDKVGVLAYWPALCLSAFCPFCTLCYMNAATDLNEKLGGEKRSLLMSCLCSWFCSCCVIAQDAQSLDECTGAAVTCCGVEGADASE